MKFIKYAFLFLALAIPFYLVVTSQGSTEHHPSPPCDNPKLLSGLADVIDAQSDHHVKVLDSKNYQQISYDEKTDHRYCTGNFLLSLGSYSIAYETFSLSRQDRETTEICHSATPNLG